MTDTVGELHAVLEATGVAFVLGGHRTGHLQVYPRSNLHPWTPEEQATLEAAARTLVRLRNRRPYEITYRMVRASGRYFEEYEARPGFGFRLY